MKKILSALLTLLVLSQAYATESALNNYQFSLGYTNSNFQNRSDKEAKQNGVNGITIGFSRQFSLPNNFSTASGLDLSFNNKTEKDNDDKFKTETRSVGLTQTLYYIINQGNVSIRPLLEVGLGNKRISFKAGTNSIIRSDLFYKYALGTEVLFTKNIGAQVKYGQSFSNHNFPAVFNKVKLKENTLAVSLVYGI